MILAIIAAVVCIIAGAVCFIPYFRKMPLLRPVGIYLIFEGVIHIFTYIYEEVYPASAVPSYVDRIGTILIIVYFIFMLIMTMNKSKKKKFHEEVENE